MSARWLDAAAVHAALAGQWRNILVRFGVDDSCLTGRHGPCPLCGGRDRWRFDDREGRGTWFCNGCGAGDGFNLIMRLNRCDFRTALRIAADTICLRDPPPLRETEAQPARQVAQPSPRVQTLLRTSAQPEAVQDAIDYLASRCLYPLPDGCSWRAHAAAEYWCDGAMIGRFSALIAPIADAAGDLVTAHVTYLDDGQKLATHPPRKILGQMTGRLGCAVRLVPAEGEILGVAEGIETALAAHRLTGLPVWAALNTAMLGRFLPPPDVHRVVIFADRDVPGLEAAHRLRDELDGRATCEVRVPPPPHKDWADVLGAQS